MAPTFKQRTIFAAAVTSAAALGFVGGVARTRQILVDTAEAMAAQPVNSFTKCLTEGWEQTGELDPEWKGKRKWGLQDVGAEAGGSDGR